MMPEIRTLSFGLVHGVVLCVGASVLSGLAASLVLVGLVLLAGSLSG